LQIEQEVFLMRAKTIFFKEYLIRRITSVKFFDINNFKENLAH